GHAGRGWRAGFGWGGSAAWLGRERSARRPELMASRPPPRGKREGSKPPSSKRSPLSSRPPVSRRSPRNEQRAGRMPEQTPEGASKGRVPRMGSRQPQARKDQPPA